MHMQGKNKTIDGLPPTQIQHVKRAAYQAGHCWAQATIVTPELSSPSECGWKKNANGWGICWTTLPEASKTYQELIPCGCKKDCRGHCKCRKAELNVLLYVLVEDYVVTKHASI